MTYRIRVRTIEGNILTYNNVKSYSTENCFLEFIDAKTGRTKIFSTQQAEIEKEEENEEKNLY